MSVIVPVYNSIVHLPPFFDSLAAALPESSEVIVIDDASTQPVLDAVPDLPHADAVVRLRNDTNVGYSGAVNRGFAVASGDVIVQLNVDVVLDVRCIRAMLDLISRHATDVGIVGSKLIYPTTGRVQSVGMAFGSHSKRHVFRHLPDSHPLCQPTRELQITTGATVGMTKRALELLGPLDEELYNHNLDLDHCLRAVRQGLRNFMCSESVAYHWRNQSGTIRYARVEAAEAAFWSKWGGRYRVDLGDFVDEALDHVFRARPELERMGYSILDLTRGADQPVVMERLEARWPGISSTARDFRQLDNPAPRLWLPTLLPHWVGGEPSPFLYLVDSCQDLEENFMWFRRRRGLVADELIVDLSAAVLPTSEFIHRVEGSTQAVQ